MSYQSKIDLHTHSTSSDGALSPTDLVQNAARLGIETLALTDHDTVSGLNEAQAAAQRNNVTLINGIELSTQWDNKTIHIVGLNINPDSNTITNATHHLKELREERAIKIGEKLAKAGIHDAYTNAKQIAGKGTVTRQHFSQFLIKNGNAKSQTDVFKRFLVKNKPGYVSVNWPDLNDTVHYINAAGGVAVIAHPLRYKMTATKLRKLITDFKEHGGKGIEVVTGHNLKPEIELAANYAKQYDIAASIGSDFHNKNTAWGQLGKLKTLPRELTPIWETW